MKEISIVASEPYYPPLLLDWGEAAKLARSYAPPASETVILVFGPTEPYILAKILLAYTNTAIHLLWRQE